MLLSKLARAWWFHGALVVAIVAFAALYACEKSETVATIDLLREPRASFVARAGDRLELRSSVRSTLTCDDLAEKLGAVKLSVRVEGQGESRETSCLLREKWYGGREGFGADPPRCRMFGIRNRCEVTLAAPGEHVVHVTADWGSLQPTEATIEISRRADR